jgi:hypothetical protein
MLCVCLLVVLKQWMCGETWVRGGHWEREHGAEEGGEMVLVVER